MKEQCIGKMKGGRNVRIALPYDAVLRDRRHNETDEFKTAINNRYRIERRFATMVANHGLRRCRYLRLAGAKIHITMANIACNIVRMVRLLCDLKQPALAMS